jgi:hypothetical protein
MIIDEENKLKSESSLKFNSKSEIAECIRVLTPFTNLPGKDFDFAIKKIQELTKLL